MILKAKFNRMFLVMSARLTNSKNNFWFPPRPVVEPGFTALKVSVLPLGRFCSTMQCYLTKSIHVPYLLIKMIIRLKLSHQNRDWLIFNSPYLLPVKRSFKLFIIEMLASELKTKQKKLITFICRASFKFFCNDWAFLLRFKRRLQ